jgi:hypothetical protein
VWKHAKTPLFLAKRIQFIVKVAHSWLHTHQELNDEIAFADELLACVLIFQMSIAHTNISATDFVTFALIFSPFVNGMVENAVKIETSTKFAYLWNFSELQITLTSP